LRPNSHSPMNVDSTKNASRPSMTSGAPEMFPTNPRGKGQLTTTTASARTAPHPHPGRTGWSACYSNVRVDADWRTGQRERSAAGDGSRADSQRGLRKTCGG
jgi:hypothetical protein